MRIHITNIGAEVLSVERNPTKAVAIIVFQNASRKSVCGYVHRKFSVYYEYTRIKKTRCRIISIGLTCHVTFLKPLGQPQGLRKN